MFTCLFAPALVALLAGSQLAAAHMEMSFPAPFRSKFNPNVAGGDIDYSMTAPLDKSGSDYPCKGYHKALSTAAGKSTATFAPGSAHNFTIVGGAAHGGGSCQASLSYDGGKTFTVISSIVGGCPLSANFPFTIPADAQTGDAIFAWTWFNNLGNREMYMNCAAVTIGSESRGKREEPSSWVEIEERSAYSRRPQIFVANTDNGCTTVDSADVLFPNPGPDTVLNNPAAKQAAGNCGYNGSPAPGSGLGSGSGSGSSVATALPTPAIKSTSSSPPQAAPTPTAHTPGTTCTNEGRWVCNSEERYQRCASGEWSPSLSMAEGHGPFGWSTDVMDGLIESARV
ncbi:hypothetical protein B0H63DRAFT_504698 [Podospora didyma]|uniref:Glycoside Hydrolase Family 61 n=1 Tax=Podospora didyma TaxID=330526 RepID=A0AAE0N203_9PEZI|nr:hypothetical protein B0H63DRAFT_504698 [Podospora didyma]